jgi:hypothetical protein
LELIHTCYTGFAASILTLIYKLFQHSDSATVISNTSFAHMAEPSMLQLGITHVYISVVSLALLALAVYTFATYDKRRTNLPPKIPAWPIVNHTYIQMQDDMPPILREWGSKYGELFRTRAGTTDFVWLNSKEAVKELYDRRSAIYSSRQPMPMAFDCAT